jgi:hypothetical protein
MRKQFIVILIPILFLGFISATVHKFHIALYQIEFASDKKMLQITTRFHIDDLNKALEKKHKKKIFIEAEKNSTEELLFKEYILNRFSIDVNRQTKTLNFLSKEIDGDELVCYWNIKNISKINTLEIKNSVLTDVFSDQQNLVNVSVFGKKQSHLYTQSSTSKEFIY